MRWCQDRLNHTGGHTLLGWAFKYENTKGNNLIVAERPWGNIEGDLER